MNKFALLSAAAAALALTATPALAKPAPPTSAATQPARFSVIVEGKGPDVILIPGLASPRNVWDGVRGDLARHYRIHLIQIRGFAEPGGANLIGPVLDPFVAELAAYIAANHLDHPRVIGHSLGGLAALELTARHPGMTGPLMIVDSLPFIGLLFSPAATVAMVTPQAGTMRDALLQRAGAAPQDLTTPLPDCSAATPASAPAIVPGMSSTPRGNCLVNAWGKQADQRVVAQAMYDDFTADVRPDLARIAVPITLLYPQGDGARADALYRGAYAGAAAMTYVPVKDSAHFIMLDQPAVFAAALSAFLARPAR